MKWPLMGETVNFADRLRMAKFALTAKKFTKGPRVEQFEEEWNDWLGSRYSLYVSSGSTANFLMVAAIMEHYNIRRGDKVLLPACTWMTNVAPCIQLGLQPIFCDINLQDFSFDLGDLSHIAREHPDIKLIFVTHLLGFPGHNESLQRAFPSARIIDDVCESHGCEERNGNGRKVGAKSLAASFSFYFGHHMSTIEGGMVSTFHPDLYDVMKMKRSHGMARESIIFSTYKEMYPDIDSQFMFVTDGYNFRNHEICAVLGSSQLKRLDTMIEQRRENYNEYSLIMLNNKKLFHPHAFEALNSSFCFPFVCKSPAIMKELKETFIKNGIEYRPIVSGNLLRQPFLRRYKLTLDPRKGGQSNADTLHDCGIYIGNNHFVTRKDMKWLEDIIGGLNESHGF